MSNFTFLETHWTDLAKLGNLAENYVYSALNSRFFSNKQEDLRRSAEIDDKIYIEKI